MPSLRPLLLAAPLILLPLSGQAAKPKAPTKIELPNLGLGSVGGEIPKATDLKKPEARSMEVAPSVTTSEVKYTVLKVEHAMDFTRTAQGARPTGGALRAVMLSGNPPTLQKFSTLVRVKSSHPLNASIELVILDPRGDTALSGSGELVFNDGKSDEVDYLIDWAPVARPSGGDYQLLVRIAGRPMGTWPLKVEKP